MDKKSTAAIITLIAVGCPAAMCVTVFVAGSSLPDWFGAATCLALPIGLAVASVAGYYARPEPPAQF